MVNVARHTVKKRGVRGGAGNGGTCLEKMRCEIIPDMFGKSCLPMTPAGEEWIDNIGCQMCHSHLYVSYDWIFLWTPTSAAQCLFLQNKHWVEEEKGAFWKVWGLLDQSFSPGFGFQHEKRAVKAVSPTFTWEKWEDTKLPRNEWMAHIHFRGTSFSHYIAINSTGCGLYLVRSWSRPRDMRLLTHDSSLILVLAPHHVRPKTNLFLSENENLASPNHGIRQRGMLAYAADKLRWKNGHFDSQFLGWIA